MKVSNMISAAGNPVANQFVISGAVVILPDDTYTGELFQSYNSVIALKAYDCNNTGNTFRVFLDERFWDYSVTTGRYRNQFLGEGIAETRKKIESGEYTLVNLNG